MLWTDFFIPTLRETPKEADVSSHMLLLRSGAIRQIASGIYTILPLGKRVIEKIASIVREEMNAVGANEVIFPLMQPAELWIESGRWNYYGKELFRLKDRFERDFALAPTHEEVCTVIASHEVHSYKQLPLILYQIHWKLRDEVRPRYGLLRAREFLMKDAYSFHSSFEDLDTTYNEMYNAYSKIFSRLSLNYVAVQADTGAIGGSASHEFMVIADIGEDTIVYCSSCAYTANIEKACSRVIHSESNESSLELTLAETPNARTIEALVEYCSIDAHDIMKCVAYIMDDERPILVCILGDRLVNETKLASYLNAHSVRYANQEEVARLFSSYQGSIGPKELPNHIECIIDEEIDIHAPYLVGANKHDMHYMNFIIHRDMNRPYTQVDIRTVAEGDLCCECSSPLVFNHGIEVGHIFKLGTKYSEAMNASFLTSEGSLQPFVMGCYGIGISRILSAIVEQFHDEKGICFPLSVAPFHCLLLTLDSSDEIVQKANELYTFLSACCDVLYDNRDERVGVKLNDADLIGVPLQIVLGKKGYARGVVECKIRADGKRFEIPLQEFNTAFFEAISSHYPEFLEYCSL